MAKTWSADNPKAALMTRKRAVIVDAALRAFLEAGYAEASVNHIAAAAGVSIKTLHRHYESKDDLFSAVRRLAASRPVTAMHGISHRQIGTPYRRPRRFHRPGRNIFATPCLRISWRSTASSPAMRTAFPSSAGAIRKWRPVPAMPSSLAISIYGGTAKAGTCVTSGPPPGV